MTEHSPWALLIIDDPHHDPAQIRPALTWLVSAARQLHQPVLELRGGPALRETDLHARLQEVGIQHLVLCGVGTHAGVLATAQDARHLGYQVTVISDATTAPTLGKHQTALRAIMQAGGQVRTLGDLLKRSPAPLTLTGLGSGGSVLRCGALRAALPDPDRLFERVAEEVTWSTMRHRGGLVPRLMAVQGQRSADGAEPLYRHPADEQPPLTAWTPTVDAIRREVEQALGHPLNHGLLQYYRTGHDFIGEHSDKTLDVVRGSKIVNVSLGRTRTMVLKPKAAVRAQEGAPATQRFPLVDGSLFVMDLATNRDWYHAIKQEGEGGGDNGPRISLTFRHIGTFYDPASGALWGLGARAATREEGLARAQARAADPATTDAADAAETDRLLQLFHEENADPGFDPQAYAPGFDIVRLRKSDV